MKYRADVKYRVDVFADNQYKSVCFETVSQAIEFAERVKPFGKVFLLEEVIDGKFDVVREI